MSKGTIGTRIGITAEASDVAEDDIGEFVTSDVTICDNMRTPSPVITAQAFAFSQPKTPTQPNDKSDSMAAWRVTCTCLALPETSWGRIAAEMKWAARSLYEPLAVTTRGRWVLRDNGFAVAEEDEEADDVDDDGNDGEGGGVTLTQHASAPDTIPAACMTKLLLGCNSHLGSVHEKVSRASIQMRWPLMKRISRKISWRRSQNDEGEIEPMWDIRSWGLLWRGGRERADARRERGGKEAAQERMLRWGEEGAF